jgi:hypothetical protein
LSQDIPIWTTEAELLAKAQESARNQDPQVERMQAEAAQARAPGRAGKVLFAFGPEQKPIDDKAVGPVRKKLETYTRLEKSLLETLDKNEVARLAFEVNPTNVGYEVIYQPKPRYLPEWLAKRIAHQDDLVAAIVRTRANQVRAFGAPRADRFSTGYVIEPREGVVDDLTDEQKLALDKQIERAVHLMSTCGTNQGVPKRDQLTFSDFLDVLTQNAIILGRIAIEKIRDKEGKVHSFRPVDSATVFPSLNNQTAGVTIRKQAIHLLARLKNRDESELARDVDLRRWIKDEYSWVQVIESIPRMVFTDDQLICRNFYPVPDIEMCGHPITPLDTVISAVMTHINLTTYTRVYFQSGRASKGMLVIKSNDADNQTIKEMQAHFQANINNANNAWRMPVFAISPEDEIAWEPIDQQGAKDSEFQYLGDAVARIILSAFQISPDELPGWAYLAKGTNAQTLSEGSNEYKLEAHRDLGIRPLLHHFEELINSELLPIVDADLAQKCRFRLMGLDADSAEREAQRLAEDQPIHMTMNQILEHVEKDALPAFLGGDVVLNPQFHQLVLDKLVYVGEIREFMMGIKGAAQDPTLRYIGNPLWLQFQQIQAQNKANELQERQVKLQEAQQAQMQQAGAQPGAAHTNAPGGGSTGQLGVEQKSEGLHRAFMDAAAALGKGEDELLDLDKAEKHLTPAQRRSLREHRRLVQGFMTAFAEDAERAKKEIVSGVEDLLRG